MPNNVQTSDQLNVLTSSQDGTSRVPRLQPKSHFYLSGTGQVGEFTQMQNQAFGALNTSQFNTTSAVSFTGTRDVFALCMGSVFLQPTVNAADGIVDPNRINVVLRPFKQPINGLNIKYIVYRGFRKSDVIDGSGSVAGNEDSGSGLVKYLWSQFNKFYSEADAANIPAFEANLLGFPFTTAQLDSQLNTDLISNYFFKNSALSQQGDVEEPQFAYELPVVPRGIHLGKAVDGIGIDIVLNEGDYIIENDNRPFQLNLAYARVNTFTLTTTGTSDPFRQKLIKETCTQFIDVAAFYGMHANGAGKLYSSENATTEVILTTKEQIAQRIQNFYTKHHFYLYIQADRQRSYNFYGNYRHSETNGNNIKIGVDETTMSETIFATNGWPIHVFDQTQDQANENNIVTFQLTTDSYDGAALYSQLGELASSHEVNFVRNENLIQLQPEDPSIVVDFNYTQAIQLSTPSIGVNTIAAFSQLIYKGKKIIVTDAVNPEKKYLLKDIDDMFGLINAKSVFSFDEESKLPTVVSEQLQIINFPNASSGKDSGAIRQQRTEDKIQTVDENTFVKRVTYETLLHSMKRDVSPFANNLNANTDLSKSGIRTHIAAQNLFYQPSSPHYLDTFIFADGNKTITGLLLRNNGDLIITKKILGIANEQIDIIKTLIINNSIVNAKLFFQNSLGEDDLEYNYNDRFNFRKFFLKVVGENLQGEVVFFSPIINIEVYTVDDLVYASSNYSKYAPLVTETNLYGSIIIK